MHWDAKKRKAQTNARRSASGRPQTRAITLTPCTLQKSWILSSYFFAEPEGFPSLFFFLQARRKASAFLFRPTAAKVVGLFFWRPVRATSDHHASVLNTGRCRDGAGAIRQSQPLEWVLSRLHRPFRQGLQLHRSQALFSWRRVSGIRPSCIATGRVFSLEIPMRRRFYSSQYSRQRGKFCLSDDAPTLDELVAERKRAAEEKAKSAAGKEPPASPLQVQTPWAG